MDLVIMSDTHELHREMRCPLATYSFTQATFSFPSLNGGTWADQELYL
jgi:hypothetical protein